MRLDLRPVATHQAFRGAKDERPDVTRLLSTQSTGTNQSYLQHAYLSTKKAKNTLASSNISPHP